jgi:hypothetical protein
VSRKGHYLDFITDILFRASLYASIGLLIEQHPGGPAWQAQNALWIGLLAALLAVIARLSRVYVELLAGPPGTSQDRPRSIADFLFSAISGVDFLSPLLVIGMGAAGVLGWLPVWLLFYSALDFLHTQVTVFPRLQ